MTKRVMTSIAIIAILSGTLILGVHMETKNPPQADIAGAISTPAPHQTLTVTQDDVAAGVDTPQPSPMADATPAPKIAQKATQSVSEPTYQWADDMAAAGIDESDYQYVSPMVLDDNGWRTTGDKLWQNALRVQGVTLTDKLVIVNQWVLKNEGSWSAAHDLWVNAGNF